MDALQAAILSLRIARLEDITIKRRKNAVLYREILDPSKAFVPDDQPSEFNTYHTFVIQVDRRDHLRNSLQEVGIETSVHYPIPIHLQPAAKRLGYAPGSFPATERQAARILTLPIHQYLTTDEVVEIATQVNRLL
jgi:dTDP-4-amino-4,6-dideoxygalactose transaminase